MTRPKTILMLLIEGFLVTVILGTGAVVRGAELPLESAEQPPQIPVGLDAYRQWDRWPYQRIGARAYMRSTYDRAGGNETADAAIWPGRRSDTKCTVTSCPISNSERERFCRRMTWECRNHGLRQ